MLVLNISRPTTPAASIAMHEDGERGARGLGATQRASRRHHGEAGALDGGLGEARDPGAGSALGLIKVLMLRCLPGWC